MAGEQERADGLAGKADGALDASRRGARDIMTCDSFTYRSVEREENARSNSAQTDADPELAHAQTRPVRISANHLVACSKVLHDAFSHHIISCSPAP